MQKVKVIVTSNRRVIRGGVALIINTAQNLEVIGNEGADVLKESFELQPDLLFYELNSTEESECEVLRILKETCSWTKLILFSAEPVNCENLKKFLGLCDGYLQGPILPGFLLKAVELACYSGYFFFLGTSKGIKPEIKEKVPMGLPKNFSIKN